MDFGLGSSCREGFNEEEQMSKGNKLPFSYSSSSSSITSSFSQYKTQMTPISNSPWEPPATASIESDSTLSASANIEKQHMFDKVVTPSDVGKLNRLVIPKQHAEKYFPLDSSTYEKGLWLNFGDRNGKLWRFRYSYWKSSQSYVMTKGWSRFVKDKKLDTGDIVSFQRGVGELGKDRLFIDWRRRPERPDPVTHHFSLHRSTPWSPLLMRPSQLNPPNRNCFSNVVNQGGTMGSVLFLRSAAAPQMGMGTVEWQQQGGLVEPIVFDSVPVVQGKGASKRLRLFGVNMECPISESHECEMLSTTTIANATMASQTPHLSSSSQHPLQLRLYNGTPVQPPIDFLNANKGKASMSLDFDI